MGNKKSRFFRAALLVDYTYDISGIKHEKLLVKSIMALVSGAKLMSISSISLSLSPFRCFLTTLHISGISFSRWECIVMLKKKTTYYTFFRQRINFARKRENYCAQEIQKYKILPVLRVSEFLT